MSKQFIEFLLVNVVFSSKSIMFYNVHTTYLTFVDKNQTLE